MPNSHAVSSFFHLHSVWDVWFLVVFIKQRTVLGICRPGLKSGELGCFPVVRLLFGLLSRTKGPSCAWVFKWTIHSVRLTHSSALTLPQNKTVAIGKTQPLAPSLPSFSDWHREIHARSVRHACFKPVEILVLLMEQVMSVSSDNVQLLVKLFLYKEP